MMSSYRRCIFSVPLLSQGLFGDGGYLSVNVSKPPFADIQRFALRSASFRTGIVCSDLFADATMPLPHLPSITLADQTPGAFKQARSDYGSCTRPLGSTGDALAPGSSAGDIKPNP